jgi:hypothetical protein
MDGRGAHNWLDLPLSVLGLCHQSRDGFPDNLDIPPETCILGIEDVEINHLRKGRAVLAADLPEAG